MALSMAVARARRQTLDLGIEGGDLIGQQLRRGERVAQIVIDLGDGQPQIGQMAALAQHGEQVGFHVGEFALDHADLVAPVAQRDG